MMAMSMDLAELDMRAAVDYLAAHEGFEGTGVGSLGSCLGGGLSVWAATANQRVDAVVTYYYLMPHGKPDFTRIDAPLLGHFGTADEFVAVDDARALEQEMESAGVSVRFEFYEGAGHPSSTTPIASAPTTLSRRALVGADRRVPALEPRLRTFGRRHPPGTTGHGLETTGGGAEHVLQP